jgi:hypothetical protein
VVTQEVRYWGPYRLLTRMRQLGWRRLPEFPGRVVRRVEAYAGAPIHQRSFGQKTFTFAGQTHHYFVHNYTTTWRNERAVEIPLALDFLARVKGSTLLEVGNVTRHFDRTTDHVVVDKYDDRPGVLSVDIDTYQPDAPFGALLSISTLEHVGWDEEPRDPQKLRRVLEDLHRLVVPGGEVLVTLPIGYNDVLDALLADDQMPFADGRFLARQPDGEWLEVEAADALEHAYGRPFDGANAIYVGSGLAT